MSDESHLLWTVSETAPATETEFIFGYDPIVGFTDLDFHAIGDEDWPAMRCPEPEATATLVVPASLRLDEIQHCLDVLATKAGFKNVRVTLRQ